MPSARIHPVANERLAELKNRLYKEMGVTASRDDIASAAVYGVTLDQVWGMLSAFKKNAAIWEEEHGNATPDSE